MAIGNYKNGYWPDSELVTVQGSGTNAIRLNKATAAVWNHMKADSKKDGVTLTLVSAYRGVAGYRAWATQLDMRARPQLYSITPGIVSGLPSGHGDGDCMDIDGGLAWVKKNGSKYGVTFPLAFDHNHARYDMTTLAGETGSLITDTAWNEGAEDMNYRLFSLANSIAPGKRAASNPDGVTLALGEMDPRWNKGGRNVWVEAPLDQVRDWVNFWGPAKELDADIWQARSNQPGRISTFPPDSPLASGTIDLTPVLDAIAALPREFVGK